MTAPGACANETHFSASRFTGKERDAESGNDYFEARYYSSNMGRFMSPDWSAKEEPVPYATMDDPQSLNLYSYVRNNPLTRVDADGHFDWDSAIVSLSTAAGGVAGTFIGATVGAGAGTLALPGGGTIGGGIAGGAFGGTTGAVIGNAIGKGIVNALNSSSSNQSPTTAPSSPDISHSDVKGRTPAEIDKIATDKGLLPKGSDPKAGKGAYVDPVTGEQRVLVHPDDGHAHVNNPAGERLGPDGSVVPEKSPEAHIPIKKDTP
jgi:RHS repeat-associated protein